MRHTSGLTFMRSLALTAAAELAVATALIQKVTMLDRLSIRTRPPGWPIMYQSWGTLLFLHLCLRHTGYPPLAADYCSTTRLYRYTSRFGHYKK